MTRDRETIDYLVIGGGFYGCCLGLFLRSISQRVTIVEAGAQIMERASRVNQARVHTGFHYPRSVLTAAKSMALHRRFAADFPDAVKSDFRMLYAIARHHSKVSAARFSRMFAELNAPLQPIADKERSLFNPDLIEDAFECVEYAFDYKVLRTALTDRIDRHGVDLQLNAEVRHIVEEADGVTVTLASGRELRARYVFNVTYGQINHILGLAKLPKAALKFELAEIVLVKPPEDLAGLGITLMDGPFFSVMPYPAEDLYSLTHVRYTPHLSWTDADSDVSPYRVAEHFRARHQSQSRHMMQDSKRFVPCLAALEVKSSITDIKAVLLKNEDDDGRPILFQRRPGQSRILSILGAKIDNIYDLFDLVRNLEPELAGAHERFLLDDRIEA
jgi:glycine/D-amino acid oxidase-like deaminating enzyme